MLEMINMIHAQVRVPIRVCRPLTLDFVSYFRRHVFNVFNWIFPSVPLIKDVSVVAEGYNRMLACRGQKYRKLNDY